MYIVSIFTGWLAIGVPGNVHGLYTAYETFGSKNIGWTDLLQPTIDMLKVGYPISPAVAKVLQDPAIKAMVIDVNSTLHIFYNNQTGEVMQEGDLLQRPALVSTLERLARPNRDPITEFYDSDLTDQIVQEIQAGGTV